MAAVARDLRDTSRRESSPRPDRRRRPRLLRASATEPSITTTSNASRGAISSPQSTQRATELLNRVAVYSGPVPEYSPTSGTAPPMASLSAEDVNADRVQGHREHHSYSNGYFSFPNFDAWDGERRGEGKEEDV